MFTRPAVRRCLRGARYQSQNTMSARIKSRTTSWRSRFSFKLPPNSLTDCFTSLRALIQPGFSGMRQCVQWLLLRSGSQRQVLQWILIRFCLFLFLTTLDVIFFQDVVHQNDEYLLYYDVKRLSLLMIFGSRMIWSVSTSILSVTYHGMGLCIQGIDFVFQACSAAVSFAFCGGERAPAGAGSSGRRSRRSRPGRRKRRTRSNRSPQIRINACSSENEISACHCIFSLILLGLMFVTLSPASRDFEAEKIKALERVIQ